MSRKTFGFDGTVGEVEFAQMARFLGAPYGVAGQDDWKVSVLPAAGLAIKIGKGTGYGHGVLDIDDEDTPLQLDPISTGVRWDLICNRRTWQPPGGTSAFQKITGTASKSLPSARKTGPGVLDDQPLALVQVTAGQNVPTAVIDLRTWAAKVTRANDLLALSGSPLGAEAVVDGVRYRRELDVDGTVQTVVWPGVKQKPVTGTPGSGWQLLPESVCTRDGNRRDITLTLCHTGPVLASDANGGIVDQIIFTLDDEFTPPSRLTPGISYVGNKAGSSSTSEGSFGCVGNINTAGGVVLTSLMPLTQILQRAKDNQAYSLRCSFSFSKA